MARSISERWSGLVSQGFIAQIWVGVVKIYSERLAHENKFSIELSTSLKSNELIRLAPNNMRNCLFNSIKVI